jgi:hypothetical protein
MIRSRGVQTRWSWHLSSICLICRILQYYYIRHSWWHPDPMTVQIKLSSSRQLNFAFLFGDVKWTDYSLDRWWWRSILLAHSSDGLGDSLRSYYVHVKRIRCRYCWIRAGLLHVTDFGQWITRVSTCPWVFCVMILIWRLLWHKNDNSLDSHTPRCPTGSCRYSRHVRGLCPYVLEIELRFMLDPASI